MTRNRMLFIKPLVALMRRQCIASGRTPEEFDNALTRWTNNHPPDGQTDAAIFQTFHDRQNAIRNVETGS